MTDIRRIAHEHRRALLIIVGALVLNVGLYALVVYPLARRVESGQAQAGAATRELVTARQAFESARRTVAGKKEADEELQKFYEEVLPADQSGARRLLYPLEQVAREANLEMGVARFTAQPDRTGSGLGKLTVTLEFTGEYTNIRAFIHELENAPEFLVLEGVTVSQAEGGDGNLKVSANVATYFRVGANGN